MSTLNQLLDKLTYSSTIGSTDRSVELVKQLDADNTDPKALMWCSPKYYSSLVQVKHGVVICQEIADEDLSEKVTYIITPKPRLCFLLALGLLNPEPISTGISKSAFIGDGTNIAADVFIGENVVIETGCIIGSGSRIEHNTVIKRRSILGKNVVIGSNTVIGGVGFGYEKDDSGDLLLIPHTGNVVIEDEVEIGNCTTVDRAVLGSTILKKGSKIDNLVHIAHGVVVGERSLVIANAMVAGSVTIGDNVWVAPSASIINKASVEDNAVIGMGAVVVKNVARDSTVAGSPAVPIREFITQRKFLAALRKKAESQE
jgi:UDP-3-O-[3-hydroxymyristoyl] glucosamine N-acyltransferase